jgi:hypothetical protein
MESPRQVMDEIERGRPGTRFRRLYDARQRSPHHRLKNVLYVIGGLAVVAVGVVTYPIPVVPSEIVILLGIVFLAGSSKWGASALDGAELWLRRHFGWLIPKWKRLPKWLRMVIWAAWVVLVSAGSWFAYRALRD